MRHTSSRTGMTFRVWLNATLLAAAALLAGSAAAIEKVTLGIPTVVGPEYADFVFARELGFFRDEGIELQLVGFQGSGVVIPQVVNKSVPFALAHSAMVITAVAKGEPLPVRFVYNYLRATTSDFAVLENGPVKTLADLKGRKLGIGSLTFASIPMTRTALKDLGLEWQKDVEIRPVGVGAAAWKQLETGQVDALNLYYSEDLKMSLSGIRIRQIPYPDHLRALFGSAMLAHVDMIRENPKLVGAMGRAMAKGAVACAAARETCARAFWKFDATARPTAEKEAEWVANTVRVLDLNYQSVGWFPGGKTEWGSFADKTLDAYIDALHKSQLIPRADLRLDLIYVNTFVPEFNRFDAAAVVRKARGGN